MKKMIAKLAELGMPVDFQTVADKAGGSIGRPHLAEAMVQNGYVETNPKRLSAGLVMAYLPMSHNQNPVYQRLLQW